MFSLDGDENKRTLGGVVVGWDGDDNAGRTDIISDFSVTGMCVDVCK